MEKFIFCAVQAVFFFKLFCGKQATYVPHSTICPQDIIEEIRPTRQTKKQAGRDNLYHRSTEYVALGTIFH